MAENKKIPWWEPKTSDEDIRRVTEVLKSNYLNDGKITAEFEKKISEILNCKYAVAVPSGTMAIFAALKAADIGRGDEVVVPDLSWIAAANAVELAGAMPVFADINPNTLTIDPQDAENSITPKTKAIIPVHVSGRGADMEAIMAIAQKHNLVIIEDAAEAFLSKHKGRYLGTWGDAGVFSLSPFKIITSGQGGIVVTNNDDTYLRLKMLKDQGRSAQGTGGDDIFESIGYNLKFTNIQAAVALAQLEHAAYRKERILKTLELYRTNIRPGTVNLFPFDAKNGELPLWIDAWSEKRDELLEYLTANNIDCRKLWHPIHKQKIYPKTSRQFPQSAAMSPKSFWLPSAFTMSDEDVLTVCRYINEFFTKK